MGEHIDDAVAEMRGVSPSRWKLQSSGGGWPNWGRCRSQPHVTESRRATKVDARTVDQRLAGKIDVAVVSTQLDAKANSSTVDAQLLRKADVEAMHAVTSRLGLLVATKANASSVTSLSNALADVATTLGERRQQRAAW